ncbi:MAG: hypothetical protein RL341_2062 [Pseudomonadota bacterium]
MKLPLFPLSTVLFPGGSLPLRIFEARYMDMVKSAVKHKSVFGIVLIAKGKEVGDAAMPEAIGCTARIDAMDMNEPGILLITVRGEQRFKIQSTERLPNGLLIGDVDWIDADELLPITGEFDPCRKLLARIIHDMEESIQALPEAERGMAQRLAQPHYMDDAGWVANRITEVLPVPNAAKQKLMELQDPIARLTIVRQFLQDKKVI